MSTRSETARTVIQAAVALQKLHQLANLLQPGNGEQRWTALQKWLNENPQWKKKVNYWIRLEPDTVMAEIEKELASQFSIPIESIGMFDPRGNIRAMVKNAVMQIQTLYRERQRDSLSSITDSTINKARKEIWNWYGIRISIQQMRDLINQYPILIEEFAIGIDTATREEITNCLAKSMGFDHWPQNAESEQSWSEFWPQFKERATAAGFKIEDRQNKQAKPTRRFKTK